MMDNTVKPENHILFTLFAIAEILINYKADITTLIAALLHDVVEDIEHSLEEIESYFGTTIRYIVNGLTKGKNNKIKTK